MSRLRYSDDSGEIVCCYADGKVGANQEIEGHRIRGRLNFGDAALAGAQELGELGLRRVLRQDAQVNPLPGRKGVLRGTPGGGNGEIRAGSGRGQHQRA